MAKILVLDHETVYRNLCRAILTSEKHTVIPLSSGEQLPLMLETHEPDIVIMDPCLPGEDGFALLKQASAKTPVIVFASRTGIEFEKQTFEAGAVETLSKNADLEELKMKVRKILSSPAPGNKRTPGEKILVVDDEPNIQTLLKHFLERRGFQALLASSGEQALEIVRREHPTMILLDIRMPGMDGLETLKRIRDLDSRAGIVMATGLMDEKIIHEAAALGAYASVFKPFDLKYLDLVVLTRLTMSC